MNQTYFRCFSKKNTFLKRPYKLLFQWRILQNIFTSLPYIKIYFEYNLKRRTIAYLSIMIMPVLLWVFNL